jgi:signal transduction histidine kinase
VLGSRDLGADVMHADMIEATEVVVDTVPSHRSVADASHELRTPLTIMRTELDVTLRRPDPTGLNR